jgi:hypothetical protein
MREPPKSNAMRAVLAGDDWNEDEVIDPATGVWEGQCPRCYVYALEGSHTNPNDGLGCCSCDWRLDEHQKATPIGQNGRKVCKTCWTCNGFAPVTGAIYARNRRPTR